MSSGCLDYVRACQTVGRIAKTKLGKPSRPQQGGVGGGGEEQWFSVIDTLLYGSYCLLAFSASASGRSTHSVF